MPTTPEQLQLTLQTQRVLPVLRGSAAQARVTADNVIEAGARAVELTTTIDDWANVLAAFRKDRPEALLGVGTVLTAEHAEQAIQSGADFLVSPAAVPQAREIADRAGIVLIEGGLTPTELRGCARASGGLVKLFPAHAGGIEYLRSVSKVIGPALIIPTGGIALADVDDWLAAGAVAVGIGSGFPEDPERLSALFDGGPLR